MEIPPFGPGQRVKILYKNWRGETAWRLIQPGHMSFRSTLQHLEMQWLLEAFDVEKKAWRDFALGNITQWQPAPGLASLSDVPQEQTT